ncbi:MAG: Alpha/beta hydrolase family protein [Syntrophorhabdus sp. PtaU1.Bin153]|nr:MAG: Alpha/beta hydrolase family protein [Syntrophorhabdus sp. PtaU1.Bin153]
MSTKRVTIQGEHTLEGILAFNSKKAGVAVCHPNPLYGGDMDNNVVHAIEEGFSAKGFTTLKFNFRGVGESKGFHGEGAGEVEDLLAAVRFLRGELDEGAAIVLAGYSFGAWICSMAASRVENLDSLLLVSFPFPYSEYKDLRKYQGRIYLIGGESDDISPVNTLLEVYKEMPTINKFLKIIPTNHFYWGKEHEITDFIKEQVELPVGTK